MYKQIPPPLSNHMESKSCNMYSKWGTQQTAHLHGMLCNDVLQVMVMALVVAVFPLCSYIFYFFHLKQS